MDNIAKVKKATTEAANAICIIPCERTARWVISALLRNGLSVKKLGAPDCFKVRLAPSPVLRRSRLGTFNAVFTGCRDVLLRLMLCGTRLFSTSSSTLFCFRLSGSSTV
ncbi:MAG: hypothetical protein V7709_20660, partial [Halioglobus sp.]